ncbi:DUF6882 domain-containing protein [Azotobacter salinestris]|uniref:DUF6882 domain-containing protein n=1 Tax=Azotobacter salinestris TaxID=69964 RepID=UPI003137A579
MEVTEAYRSLVTEAHQYITECQDRLRSEYQLDAWPRYDWEQESASLVFSDETGPRVRASIQFVGSISTRSNTWLWSWANDSLLHQVTCLMSRVKEHGEQKEIKQLATDYWPADEIDGWEMTSIAGYLLGAKGAYRTPDEKGFTYMVIMDVSWVS